MIHARLTEAAAWLDVSLSGPDGVFCRVSTDSRYVPGQRGAPTTGYQRDRAGQGLPLHEDGGCGSCIGLITEVAGGSRCTENPFPCSPCAQTRPRAA